MDSSINDEEKLIKLKYNRTNFKTTIKRLRNCYMCVHRSSSGVARECGKCPPLKLIEELYHIVDYYFDNLRTLKKQQKGEPNNEFTGNIKSNN